MSINRIDFPNPAPISITDWEDIINVAEFLSLGVGNPVDYDFSSNTIKQGVQILIGGSVYQSTTATAITGTPSDYVQITPAGATASAAYVASLAGVSWNSVYNHYEDGGGNAYLFNEAKEGLVSPKTVVGKFAEDAHIGTLTTRGQTILARDGDQLLKGESIALHSGSGTELVGGGQHALLLASSVTDAATKNNRLVGAHYTNAEEPVGMIDTANSVSANVVRIGGGYSTVNAATVIQFYTASNNTTPTGTEAGRFTTNGNLILGSSVLDPGPKMLAINGALLPPISVNTVGLVAKTSAASNTALFSIIAGNTGSSQLRFGDTDSESAGQIRYDHTTNLMDFVTNGGLAMYLTAANHLLIDTAVDSGEGFVVGSGGMRVTGTLGNIIATANGAELHFSRPSSNYIKASEVGGALFIVTNGRTNSAANSNAIFNSDLSSTFNGAVTVAGTLGNIILPSGGTKIQMSYTGQSVLETTGAGSTLGIWVNNNGAGSSYVAPPNVLFGTDVSSTFNGNIIPKSSPDDVLVGSSMTDPSGDTALIPRGIYYGQLSITLSALGAAVVITIYLEALILGVWREVDSLSTAVVSNSHKIVGAQISNGSNLRTRMTRTGTATGGAFVDLLQY